MKSLLITSLTLLVLSVGCSSTSKDTSPRMGADAQAGKTSVLTREAAMFRSRQIHKITYQLWFALDAVSDEFQGRSKIVFDLREGAFSNTKSLRLDFTGGKITSFVLNGTPWDAEKIADRANGEWVEIPKGDLAIGQNKLEIAYTHPYSKSGNGLYRFKDPEDGNIYIASHLEPYAANLVFPSFDQPDLKASFEVTTETPKEWTVVGIFQIRVKSYVVGRVSSQFAPSPQMSTYLFALNVGPWKQWKSEYEGIPMALYARQSVAKFVDSPEWFKITAKGLEFYADFFGYPYPFAKYDQILVPDHNAGAMENIGAVTFNEKFIFRGPATEEDRRDRADTILHEMAHMWFGDLVTMRWWNGLWLNESFATYMSSVALERTKLFSGAPQAFFSGMKRWAYGEDQLPTTHPIEVSVADTNQATANFDGITYGKGAAALKQLHYLLGDEDFQEGLHRYFTRFANRNTSLADFMNVMAQTSERTLTPWTQSWLQTFGYNQIAVDVACGEDGKITKLDLLQKADATEKRKDGSANVLRPHSLQVGLYYKDGAGRLAKKSAGLKIRFDADKVSVDEAIGKKCPDLIFPNDEDYGYFMTELDAKSLATVQSSLAKITDPFTRHLMVFTLWEMVKSGKMKVADFGTSALEWLKTENNKTLLEDLSSMLTHPRRVSVARVLEGEARAKFIAELHALAVKKATYAQPGSDLQRIWFSLALYSLDSSTSDWAMKLYTKKAKISGLKLDTDLRWDILSSVSRVSPIDGAILDAAAKEDPSSEGASRLLGVRATLGLPEAAGGLDFPGLFTMEKVDASIPNARLRKAMNGYIDYRNPSRTTEWKARYFASLEAVAAKSDDSYFRAFAQSLYPSDCTKTLSAETTAWLESHSKIPKTLRIAMEKLAFSEGWCAAIRAGEAYPLWKMKE